MAAHVHGWQDTARLLLFTSACALTFLEVFVATWTFSGLSKPLTPSVLLIGRQQKHELHLGIPWLLSTFLFLFTYSLENAVYCWRRRNHISVFMLSISIWCYIKIGKLKNDKPNMQYFLRNIFQRCANLFKILPHWTYKYILASAFDKPSATTFKMHFIPFLKIDFKLLVIYM